MYSCAGKLIRSINVGALLDSKWRFADAAQWDKGSIKGLGWSEDGKLLVVTDDGTVRCYYDLQGDFAPFTLGHVYHLRFYTSVPA